MAGKRLGALGGLGLTFALAVCGCARTPPAFTEVSGVVLLDGKPLPLAQVEFVPELSDFGAEMNSTAITDDQGKFTLTCPMQSQTGAVVAKHRVLVRDAPTPQEFRRPDGQTQEKLAQYMERLKNRPIPLRYGALAKTITIEVKPEQKNYEIRLTR
jgi:hypothetical protein